MKNYYELPRNQRKKWKSDFDKCEFAKNVNFFRIGALYIIFIIVFGLTLFGIIAAATGIGCFDLIDKYSNILYIILILMVIEFFTLEIVLRVAFVRWLKVRHRIQY